jgi:hypothetical protein
MDIFIHGFCILLQNVSISKPPTVYFAVILQLQLFFASNVFHAFS